MTTIDLFQQSYSYKHHYLHLPGCDVFAFLDKAAADGFTGVSININGPNYRQLSGTSVAHQRKVGARLRELRLRCDLETSGTERTHLESILEVCANLGAEQLRTYMRHAGSVAETIDRTIADLRVAGPIFERAGVRLMLENHEDFTGVEMATILSSVDHPWVGVLYDYGNSMMVGEEPMTALAAMLPYVRSAHLKDHACRVAASGERQIVGVPIGSGVLPIAEATRALVAGGLDRIILSSVWGYQAPVRDWRGDGVWGQGVFRVEQPPFDPLQRPWDAAALAARDPRRLVELEYEAVEQGQAWLRAMLRDISVDVRAR
jgi:sugar phosphate isomerase/epimerase